MADLFNAGGWRAIAGALMTHFGIRNYAVFFEESKSLAVPGQCQKLVRSGSGFKSVQSYTIKIRAIFLDDPFAITAILAHELCHVIEARHLAACETDPLPQGKALTELERTVDLLVFLFQLGEFQLRVARESHLSLGYFNQEMFERMYVILERRRNRR